ncbi:MAG: UDP-N-acetylmuramoyl-L-alanine--D-glutamate ligase [bacterium]|nr:UDP-N-acetylmuramoyl-L-alanine--D-glutamate ligase [bacterium]
MELETLRGKRILILGFGKEGRDTLSFLRKRFPGQGIGIADQKSSLDMNVKGVTLHLGKSYLRSIKKYEIIIKSPGIPPRTIAPYIGKKQNVTSQTAIFFANCKGTIIGVTGTKGKSTTSSLIHHVLKKGGVRAHLIGNIGKPALQFLSKGKNKDVFVYELSSFQLGEVQQSPHIAILLNIYPEHLDYYKTFQEYAGQKAKITQYQGKDDILIFNRKDPVVSAIASKSKAKKMPFVLEKGKGLWIASKEPALFIGKLYKIPKSTIEHAINTFKPLPYRLEKVGEWKGVSFVNDSLATIPEATISALDVLEPKVATLIAGGLDRNISFQKLSKRIAESKIRTLILFPQTGKKILQGLRRPPQTFFAQDMKEAVRIAYKYTPQGTICLLSPAAPSFNLFRDYKDRGDQFVKWASYYGKKNS